MVIKKHNKNPNDSIATEPTAATDTSHYPRFIYNVMDKYFETRVKKSWLGSHILHGKAPTPNSLIFSSNDYLNISQN